jgi:hypothetical protein
VYAKDLVPLLPTMDVNTAYRHLNAGIWTCQRGEQTWSGPTSKTDFALARLFVLALITAGIDFVSRRLYAGAPKLLPNFALPYSLDDHSPMNYLRVSKYSYLTRATEDTLPRPGKSEVVSGESPVRPRGGRDRGAQAESAAER